MSNTKETEDLILIQNILNGNQASQEILYNKYKKIITDFINYKYKIKYDLEDDVSEILIKVFLNLNTFDQTKSKFKSWVISITNNYMIDKWRNNSITFNNQSISILNIEWSEENYLMNNTSISTNSSDFEFENINSINYISEQLSPIDYTMLDMKYNLGYNYNEIGKEFNVSSSTISNKVNYIKTKLKKQLIDK